MLGFFAAVYDRTKQVAVRPTQTGQNKGVPLITLALALRDGAGLARVGHHDLHSERVKKSTSPRRMHSASMTTKAPGYALASFASSLRSLRIEPLFTISPRVPSTQNVCLLSPRSRPMVACAFRGLRVVFSIRHRAYYPRTAASQGSLCLLI